VNGPHGIAGELPRPGELRIHFGAAPGVGKTFAMLCEARRRRDRGTDVVVGLVETHGRSKTAGLLEGLEVLPRRRIRRGDVVVEELDVPAVLARRPEVVLVLEEPDLRQQDRAEGNARPMGGASRRGAVHRAGPRVDP
jgi:K+-sensing histidine kinase KdpD